MKGFCFHLNVFVVCIILCTNITSERYEKLKRQQMCLVFTVYQVAFQMLGKVFNSFNLQITTRGEGVYYPLLMDGKLKHREVQ